MITRQDRNQTFDANGNLVAEQIVETDITAPAIHFDLHDKLRQALRANAAFLDDASPTNAQTLAQVRRLTRECSALIRLLIALDGVDDLLVENGDT